MLDALGWLFSSQNFMPHGHCFLWQPGTLWLNVGSDALIAAAYFSIPLAIYSFVRRRREDIHYAWVAMMFAGFILLCGATHVMEIVTVWNPLYRVAGALKLVTGVVSVVTSLSLVWILPQALALKTPRQLESLIRARTQELTDINMRLRAQIEARDLVERQLRETERERAQTHALLHTIVESAPSLIYAKDRDGRMLLANPPALALIGKPWTEVKGRTDLELLADQHQAESVTRNDRRLMEANATESLEEAVGAADGAERVWFSTKAPLRDADGNAIGLVGVSVEITEQKRFEHRLRLMVDELNHRVKNTLATVQAIAAQTLRDANPGMFEAFQGRLRSLAAAHDVLTREHWAGADLFDVAAGQLIPAGGPIGGRFQLSGPPLRLSAKATLVLAMGLHELAINALKYGALSNDDGKVQIRWEITAGQEPTLRLTWTERHGPPVQPPARTGFGSRLVERLLTRDLGGVAILDYDDPEGCTFVLETSLANVVAPRELPPFPRVGATAAVTA
jgi:PAS domain S-box-containing protein